MKTWNPKQRQHNELNAVSGGEKQLQVLAEVFVLIQLAIEAVLSIHLDREPTTLVDQENHVHLRVFFDNKIVIGQEGSLSSLLLEESLKRKHSKRSSNELQNWLWSSLWEVLTTESPNGVNKDNKLAMCQTRESNLTEEISPQLTFIYTLWFSSLILGKLQYFTNLNPKCFPCMFLPFTKLTSWVSSKVSGHYESLESFYQMAARQAIWQSLWD